MKHIFGISLLLAFTVNTGCAATQSQTDKGVADCSCADSATLDEAGTPASDDTMTAEEDTMTAQEDTVTAEEDTPKEAWELLPGAEWRIEDIANRGVIDRSHATLQFSEDGLLSGSATCNRYTGSYENSDASLSIVIAGTTKMLCPEALMNQERLLLSLLPETTSFAIDETGALILTTTGGETITARR